MATSYEKIDYRIRPAKSIERKMLCEAFHKLSYFEELSSYRYIGFGSTFFADFSLIHRLLDINKMISIEKDIMNKERFEFNRPYNCIKIVYGNSYDVLPRIEWKEPSILWLDYDSKLNINMLTDIGTFIASATSGSLIVITVDTDADELDIKNVANSRKFSEELQKYRYNELLKRITGGKIPAEVKDGNHLDNIDNHKAIYKVINNEIKDICRRRNAGQEDHKFIFKQLFNFVYNDSSNMLSIGGILYDQNDKGKIDKCNFESLKYFRSGETPYYIDVPKLTLQEIRSLNRILPKKNATVKLRELKCVRDKDKENYAKIYRYFPHFVEAEII